MGLVNSNVQCYLSPKSRKCVNQKRRREKRKRKDAEQEKNANAKTQNARSKHSLILFLLRVENTILKLGVSNV